MSPVRIAALALAAAASSPPRPGVALSARVRATAPAAAPPAPLVVSGLLYASFGVNRSTTPNQLANQVDNSFLLDRAYLTVRAPVGERASVRVTTDIYQTTEATVNAYAIRAKYAYLQYDGARRPTGAQGMGRLGILQTVVIEHVESFWPRLLSQTALERAGYFASADVGIAGHYLLPGRFGEMYATVTNGSGFASRERDRFKDYAARVTLTPLASRPGAGLLQTFTLTAWGYKGATASAFVNGGAGQVGAVGDALDRSRAGMLVGIRDHRLTLAGELAASRDGRESGANTDASPRTTGAVHGRLTSGIAVVRPLAFLHGTPRSPLALIGRLDVVRPTARSENVPTPLPSSNAYHNLIAGLSYDVSPRITVAADYEESLASRNGVSSAPPNPSKAYLARLSVAF